MTIKHMALLCSAVLLTACTPITKNAPKTESSSTAKSEAPKKDDATETKAKEDKVAKEFYGEYAIKTLDGELEYIVADDWSADDTENLEIALLDYEVTDDVKEDFNDLGLNVDDFHIRTAIIAPNGTQLPAFLLKEGSKQPIQIIFENRDERLGAILKHLSEDDITEIINHNVNKQRLTTISSIDNIDVIIQTIEYAEKIQGNIELALSQNNTPRSVKDAVIDAIDAATLIKK